MTDSDDEPRAATFLDGAFGLTPAGFIVRRNDPRSYCYTCGVELDGYSDDADRGYCQEHCPDHDFVYDFDFRFHACKLCGARADNMGDDW